MEYDDQTEITDYAWNHLTSFMTEFERKVGHAIMGRRKSAHVDDHDLKSLMAKRWGLVGDSEVDEALVNGADAFRRQICARVLREHGDKIVINRCPKCNRVVRTPKARQCFWCGHDWHDCGN